MNEEAIELFLQLNEPAFEVGGKQYSVCCPGTYYATWDERENRAEFSDIRSLLDDWIVDGKPFRNVVQQILEGNGT